MLAQRYRSGGHQILVNATPQIAAVNTLNERHLGLHLTRAWIGDVVLDPSWLEIGLVDDGLQQAIAINTRNVLHPRSHLSRVAAELQVSSVVVEYKDVHVPVIKALGRIGKIPQETVFCGALAVHRGSFYQGHGVLR